MKRVKKIQSSFLNHGIVFLILIIFLIPVRGICGTDKGIDRWHEFLAKYTGYFQENYGPEIKSRYQLYMKEVEEMKSPGYNELMPPVIAKSTLKR